MKFVASRDHVAITAEVANNGSIGVCAIPDGLGIEVELNITPPGMAREADQPLFDKAHIACPNSNATRGKIGVTPALA
jgi:organic hydroperoxide reductase OsmC/OhrA